MVDQEIECWRKVLHRVVVVIKALASRGLSFRGRNETFGFINNGNYMLMMETISVFYPFLADHIREFGNPGSGQTYPNSHLLFVMSSSSSWLKKY
jgi:hypothetical protein